MQCPKCGFEIQESTKFCPQCGTQLSGDTIEEIQWHKPSERFGKRVLRTILKCILGCLIWAVAFGLAAAIGQTLKLNQVLYSVFVLVVPVVIAVTVVRRKKPTSATKKETPQPSVVPQAEKAKKQDNNISLFGKNATKRVQELEQLLKEAQQKLDSLGYDEYADVKKEIDRINGEIVQNNDTIAHQQDTIKKMRQEAENLYKQNQTAFNKLSKSKELYKSIEYAIASFFDNSSEIGQCRLSDEDSVDYDSLSPSIILKLHLMDVRSLRKAYRDNDKLIGSLLTKYSVRYTTKSNQAIYQLMVIALRAELQNILYNLKYEKLDSAVDQVKTVTTKYLKIATEGNQSIAGTMTRFIGEIEYLFINAVKIEYNYYVKKEQARQEQAEIREKMRQEAAERKALEAERKKIEVEESKYNEEISRVKQQLETASGVEAEQLRKRVLALETMLSDVVVKREEIANLQNGKAGNIYIISNLGAFGDNVFKIGMTRRLDPQDRIDELGSASVPFRFDVHSFIFSEDAVDLENRLHKALDNKRVNKVNLRKEFFYATIDELEKLVLGIDPTAEFNRTMVAEEFRQSQSTDTIYTSEYSLDNEESE